MWCSVVVHSVLSGWQCGAQWLIIQCSVDDNVVLTGWLFDAQRMAMWCSVVDYLMFSGWQCGAQWMAMWFSVLNNVVPNGWSFDAQWIVTWCSAHHGFVFSVSWLCSLYDGAQWYGFGTQWFNNHCLLICLSVLSFCHFNICLSFLIWCLVCHLVITPFILCSLNH